MNALLRLPLRVLVPVLLTAPVVVLSIAMLLTTRHFGVVTSREYADAVTHATQSRITDRVVHQGGRLREIVELNWAFAAQGILDPHDPRSMSRVLIDQMLVHQWLGSLGWGSDRTGVIWVARYVGTDGLTLAIQDGLPGSEISLHPVVDGRVDWGRELERYPYDIRTRPWFVNPLWSGGASWTDPFVWTSGGEGSPSSVGLGFGKLLNDQDGKPLGVIDAEFTLVELNEFLREIRLPDGAVVTLLDQRGTLIASSRELPESSAEALVDASMVEDPVVRTAAAILRSNERLAGEVAEVMLIDGERYWERTTGIPLGANQTWTLSIFVPDDTLLASLRMSIARQVGAFLLLFVVTVVLGVVIGRNAVKPMTRIGRHAQRIAEGDFGSRIPPATNPELRTLGAQMNEMAEKLGEHYEIRRALELASEVQQALLPKKIPSVPGLRIAAFSEYCDETGGDYYDFFGVAGQSEDELIVAVGDVSGHGISSAMLMATARGMLRSRAVSSGSLCDLLEHVNTMLVTDSESGRFMTMQLIRLEPASGLVRWASAGHGAPIVYEPDRGSFFVTEGGGPPLGILDAPGYEEVQIDGLREGAMLVSATDGLWEAFNADGEQFGEQRMLEIIRTHGADGPERVVQSLRDALADHLRGAANRDDVTCVVAQIVGV